MGSSEKDKVDLKALKNRFKAGCVPSDVDFTQLINVAALSFRPGIGLEGGDKTEAGSVDLSKVVALTVKARSGVAVAQDGVSVVLGNDTGLYFTDKASKKLITLKPPKDKSLTTDGGLAIKAALPLSVKASLSIEIDEKQGLVFDKNGAIGLNVDLKTVGTDGDKVFIKCKPGAGLKIDADGYLAVDIDAVVKKF